MLDIKRVYKPLHTQGVMLVSGAKFCSTLEETWKNNASDNPFTVAEEESCIPEGEYEASVIVSPSRGWKVILFYGVPKRTAIEIHSGNKLKDTKGCILVGKYSPDGQTLGFGSKITLDNLVALIEKTLVAQGKKPTDKFKVKISKEA